MAIIIIITLATITDESCIRFESLMLSLFALFIYLVDKFSAQSLQRCKVQTRNQGRFQLIVVIIIIIPAAILREPAKTLE